MIRLEDNCEIAAEYAQNQLIQELANRDLQDLITENFIVFPPIIKESTDLAKDSCLFEMRNRKFSTTNLVGFIKKGNDEIRIHSRFYERDEVEGSDFFLRYLLQKVLNINVASSMINLDRELRYYDLLAFLFPLYLDEAMRKGVYKEYVSKQYNDANIKGPISIARHIKINTPFAGKFAYDTREFSYDNKVTQLVRHVIEKLQLEYQFDTFGDSTFKENVRAIVNDTPSYARLKRESVLKENLLNPVKHGYFEEYALLQNLCIQILNEEKIGFGEDAEKVNGIIIDVAWLWEEYLVTLMPRSIIHAENKTGKNPIYFYKNQKNRRYPDFYSECIVLDAKYKKLEHGSIRREDLYQMTSYLHVIKAQKAGVIYPSKIVAEYKTLGELEGYGGEIFKVGFKIPQRIKKYDDFIELMEKSELEFSQKINELNVGTCI